jgi:hypothetical protein
MAPETKVEIAAAAEHLCVIDNVIMPNQQYIDAAADNLQQFITGDLRPSARNLSGDRSQPGQCKLPPTQGAGHEQ